MGGSCCKRYHHKEDDDGDDENTMERLSVTSEGSARSGISSVGSSDVGVARLPAVNREVRSGANYQVDSSHRRAMLVDRKVNTSVVRVGDNYERQRETSEYGIRRHHPATGRPPKAREGEQIAAGWPSWLAGGAPEAIRGWLPRKLESFQKLNKIGQGTYSDVYRAHDLERDKIVALKKLKIGNLEPHRVHFMAREISILRQLDHPNVIKLEGLVTSRSSINLYLVLEYMEHDLLGLSTRPDVKLTEPQVKCYMQQLLRGLDHCHRHGILHRDIKGSNLLVDNNGTLKIADFGLATKYNPLSVHKMTSRVVTLWYRPPELLLGATYYGSAVDLWSTGCILAELFAGRPIMTGKTEADQLHKIFKLCGTPSEDYWSNPKLPLAPNFRPQQTCQRRIAEKFRDFPAPALALVDTLLSINPSDRRSASYALRSEFFSSYPLPCRPSELPKYSPRKDIDLQGGYRPSSQASAVGGNTKPRAVPVRDDNVLSMQKRMGGSDTRTPKSNPRQEEALRYGALTSQAGWTKLGLVKDNLPKFPTGAESSRRILTTEDNKGKAIARVPGSLKEDYDKQINNKDPMRLGYSAKGKNILHSGPLVRPVSKVDEYQREQDRNAKEAIRRRRVEEARNREGRIDLPTNALFVGGNGSGRR